MKNNKLGAIVALVIGILCLIGTIVCAILWVILPGNNESSICLVVGIFLLILTVTFLGVGFYQLSIYKKIAENMSNTSSLCYKTYGNGGNYTYFLAYPDKKAQDSKRATVNAVGALSFIFLGVGVFSYGAETNDVFVSDEELIINNKRKNNKLMDQYFTCIPASAVVSIQFQTDKKFQRVCLNFTGGNNILLDIPLKNSSPEFIRNTFLKLKESQLPKEEIQEAQPIASEEIFGV